MLPITFLAEFDTSNADESFPEVDQNFQGMFEKHLPDFEREGIKKQLEDILHSVKIGNIIKPDAIMHMSVCVTYEQRYGMGSSVFKNALFCLHELPVSKEVQ